jgi:iduronate 2-sulfatase
VKHFVIAGIFLSLLIPASVQGQETKRKVNVLFIAVDDLNTAIGCYGHRMVKTPNIDRLATRGVRFERAYCQYPLCNPSRTSLLSGRRPDTTRVFLDGAPAREFLPGVDFLPEYFRRFGYFTAHVGKIGGACRWDVSIKSGHSEKEGGKLKIEWRATKTKDEEEPDGKTAREAVRLLEQNKGKAFFLAVGFGRPHLPFVAPQKYFDLYPPDKVMLPKEPADVRKNVPAIAFDRHKEKLTEAEARNATAAYYACVSFMDAQLGVLLDAMDRLELWDNTVVIFWSDHGFHLGEHGGLWRKAKLFEECARVPLIVAAPGKQKGATSPRLAELVDLYPTLTQLCGLPTPKGMEGTSLVPLLEDPRQPWKKAAFIQVAHGRNHDVMGRSVRTERYRYTEWADDKEGVELYDHASDPREYINLAMDRKHAETIAELKQLLNDGWQKAKPPTPRK